MIYVSNFRNFPTCSMCTSQSTQKMVANNGQLKQTICDVKQFFNVNTGNAIQLFDVGG